MEIIQTTGLLSELLAQKVSRIFGDSIVSSTILPMLNHIVANQKRNITILIFVFALLLTPGPVRAWETSGLTSFREFTARVMNGNKSELRGIYVPGNFAYDIVDKPAGDPTFVSPQSDTVTKFDLSARHGSIGLLAHNYLAGEEFFSLEKGQVIYLIYGDGEIDSYVVKEFLRYRALSPESITSNFIDLNSGDKLSASELFYKVFRREGELILQTCIAANGDPSWGRLFVVAEPFDKYDPKSINGK